MLRASQELNTPIFPLRAFSAALVQRLVDATSNLLPLNAAAHQIVGRRDQLA
ncbi:TPA: hypothetical protein HH295_14450 [Xanthomonas vasicola pv. zeae]|uniref:hypothetical protein n=1 Tax=Xanthomonas vasicola TaxID=56459 RepID=UPI0012D3658D|nr:hypothetical protein [Xanthomonas vasicola]MDO6950864.1 hypothetical protein [Xanthomonas vasicola]MDO6955260.1 hypothetical protein [Xanthomonas vasicola]HHZ23588.1 hypothetical protein [Xanthomonas vasicola pv. zeae]HHZ31811.1 hypothetical protein [Xanthomonas vasicola pv. zeae]HHZ35686.1 hypothetical protein [Xanthomonas vasicola pv. zeae]